MMACDKITKVLQKVRIYNITPFATKFCMFIMVEMLYILFARRCMLNKILVEISVRYNLTGSAYFYYLCMGHFTTDLCIFLSRHTFTHYCIGHFPTDLRIILSHFVAKDVYALSGGIKQG